MTATIHFGRQNSGLRTACGRLLKVENLSTIVRPDGELDSVECGKCRQTMAFANATAIRGHAIDRSEITDTRALDLIAGIMDGTEWSADTLDEIAGIVGLTGRVLRDPYDLDESEA